MVGVDHNGSGALTAPAKESTGEETGPDRPDRPTRPASRPDDGWAQLEDLYRLHHAPMVRLAHLLTGDRAVAEELVQDAFLRLHAHLDTADEPAAYLRTTVVNLCRGDGRRRTTARRHAPAVARQRPLTTAAPPLPHDVAEVWLALQSLPRRRRDALVLRYYADLPTAEVARLLGARPATARSLIRRGLASLEEALRHD